MEEIKIYDLNQFPTNTRNGSYGGAAGSKEGIDIEKEHWIIKYPQTTRGMKGDLLSYTTAPLSEYLGSHIYQMLGIDVHDTLLGIRNNKLVVACKDFCQAEGSLREIRTLKNIYNKELSERLEQSVSSTSSSHLVDLDEIMIHLTYNPVLKEIPNIKERFWQQFIVDILINNNDRNNGNWGILSQDGKIALAPVFDNGAAFSNKNPDEKLLATLSDPEKLKNSALNTATIFSKNDKQIQTRDLLKIEDNALFDVALTLVPKIKDSMKDITDFINAVPEQHAGIYVCSEVRKQYYVRSMELRLKYHLIPLYEKAVNKQKKDFTHNFT